MAFPMILVSSSQQMISHRSREYFLPHEQIKDELELRDVFALFLNSLVVLFNFDAKKMSSISYSSSSAESAS